MFIVTLTTPNTFVPNESGRPMKPLIFDVALPSTFALGALLGRFASVQAFILLLVVGIAAWAGICLIGGVPLVAVLLTSLCLAVASQVGYAACLVCRALLVERQNRKRQR